MVLAIFPPSFAKNTRMLYIGGFDAETKNKVNSIVEYELNLGWKAWPNKFPLKVANTTFLLMNDDFCNTTTYLDIISTKWINTLFLIIIILCVFSFLFPSSSIEVPSKFANISKEFRFSNNTILLPFKCYWCHIFWGLYQNCLPRPKNQSNYVSVIKVLSTKTWFFFFEICF